MQTRDETEVAGIFAKGLTNIFGATQKLFPFKTDKGLQPTTFCFITNAQSSADIV